MYLQTIKGSKETQRTNGIKRTDRKCVHDTKSSHAGRKVETFQLTNEAITKTALKKITPFSYLIFLIFLVFCSETDYYVLPNATEQTSNDITKKLKSVYEFSAILQSPNTQTTQ